MKLIKLSDEQRENVQKIALDALVELDRICRKYNIEYILAYGTLIGAVRHKGFIPWDDDIDVLMRRDDLQKFREVCKKELNSKFFYQCHATDREYYYLFDKIRVNNTTFKESFLAKNDIHHGIYIDIFPMDYLDNNRFKRKLQIIFYKLFRFGLNSKFISLRARHGKKKFLSMIMRWMFVLVSKEWLYNMSEKVATSCVKCNDEQEIGCLAYSSKSFALESIYFETTEMQFEKKSFFVPRNYEKILRTMYGDYMTLPPEAERCTIHDLVELDYSKWLESEQ